MTTSICRNGNKCTFLNQCQACKNRIYAPNRQQAKPNQDQTQQPNQNSLFGNNSNMSNVLTANQTSQFTQNRNQNSNTMAQNQQMQSQMNQQLSLHNAPIAANPVNLNSNQPSNMLSQNLNQQKKIQPKFLNEYDSNHKFSINQNMVIATDLRYLSFDQLIGHLPEACKRLVSGPLYHDEIISELINNNFNNTNRLININQYNLNTIYHLFHNLNIFMGQYYYISREQVIQHILLTYKNLKRLEECFNENEMIDIDYLEGLIADKDFNQYSLQNSFSLTQHQIKNYQNKITTIIDVLNSINQSPILIQVYGNKQSKYCVFKKISNEWHFFHPNGEIYKMDLLNQNKQINFQERIEYITPTTFQDEYLGSINSFYFAKKIINNPVYININVNQIINQFNFSLNYTQQEEKWRKFETFLKKAFDGQLQEFNPFKFKKVFIPLTNSLVRRLVYIQKAENNQKEKQNSHIQSQKHQTSISKRNERESKQLKEKEKKTLKRKYQEKNVSDQGYEDEY